MTALEIVGALFSAYFTGWAWAASVLYLKRFSEVATS